MLRPLGFVALLCLSPAAGHVRAQRTEEMSVGSLISSLGSPDFRKRQAAAKALRERPDAEEALREAIRTADLETVRRAQDILDHYARREIAASAKAGRVDDFIRRVVEFPAGKCDEELLAQVLGLGRKLETLHEEKLRRKAKVLWLEPTGRPPLSFLAGERITEMTKTPDMFVRHYFVRAGEVDIDRGRVAPDSPFQNQLHAGALFVVSGRVDVLGPSMSLVLAGGPVRLRGAVATPPNRIIMLVSGGDIVLERCGVYRSIIIARGSVTMTDCQHADNTIIAGKSFSANTTAPPRGPDTVEENVAAPLGFIRWADAPKEKDGGKTPAKGGEKKQ